MQVHSQVLDYLPVAKEIIKLPKQFLVNVIYTVVGDAFADWVKQRVVARNLKIVEVQKLGIEMDPDVAAAFSNSTAVSSKYPCSSFSSFFSIMLTILSFLTASKGVGVNLLKVGSKRRRTRQEVLDQKEEANMKQEAIE